MEVLSYVRKMPALKCNRAYSIIIKNAIIVNIIHNIFVVNIIHNIFIVNIIHNIFNLREVVICVTLVYKTKPMAQMSHNQCTKLCTTIKLFHANIFNSGYAISKKTN
jgi:hypothetical protein